MPLVTCTDCGQRVSDAAPVCIHCGRPMAASQVAVDAPPRATSAEPIAPRAMTSANPYGPRRKHWAERGTEWRGQSPAAWGAAVLFVFSLVAQIFFRRAEDDDLLGYGAVMLFAGLMLVLLRIGNDDAPVPGRRRGGSWGNWFAEQDDRREVEWHAVIGVLMVVVGLFGVIVGLL
jgi:hypothetical protein